MLLAALINTAAADDRDLCNDGKAARERRLTACANAIATKQWRGTDLANLYVVRAEQYVLVASALSTRRLMIAMRR
jgi:hypothetical protein